MATMCNCRKANNLTTRNAWEHVLEDGTSVEYDNPTEAAAHRNAEGGVVRRIRVSIPTP